MASDADGPVPDRLVSRMLGELAGQHVDAMLGLGTVIGGLSEEESGELMTYVARLHNEHMETRRASEVRVACDNEASMQTDADAHGLMDLLDDVRAAVDRKYYVIAADLSPKQFEALRRILEYMAKGTSVNVVDHAIAYRGALPGEAQSDMKTFCERRGANHGVGSAAMVGLTIRIPEQCLFFSGSKSAHRRPRRRSQVPVDLR